MTRVSDLLLVPQIVEVLSHIKTRLQAVQAPSLPVVELAAILAETDRSAFAYSFSFLFIGASEDYMVLDARDVPD